MYTEAMARAFHQVRAPKNFGVELIDNDHFLVVKANEKQFAQLDDYNKRQAVEYLARVKKALEENGAIVLITRDGVE